MIIRKEPPKTEKKDEKTVKSAPQKKAVGLGRGLDSLLEDNSPTVGAKTSVVGKAEEHFKRDNSLYRKDGAMSYVKTPKRSGS